MAGKAIITSEPPTVQPSVLCIDASPGMLLVCRAMLEAHGYRVLTASGPNSGLKILKGDGVTAAVIDDGLPEMDAAGLLRAMRNIRPALPVIVFTRSPMPDNGIAETEICVAKASGPKALLAAIDRACGMNGFKR